MDQELIKELLEGPGLKPPPGIKPNFENPPSQYETNVAVVSLCFVVATFCVVVRGYTRFVIMRSHGWEDYTCFVAYLGLIVYVILMLLPIFRYHAGIHQWNIQGKTLVPWVKIANGVEITYIPTIFIAKLSILLMYLRLFVPGYRSKTYWTIQGVILFNFLFYLANIPIEIWPCVPRSKLWNPLKPGHCINNEAVFVAGGSINMISDFVILLIPMIIVWRLKMARRKRLGVSGIFAFGVFGCIASIMHLATSVPAARSHDETYYLFPVALWTLAEITSAIVCSCLIFAPNFFHHVAPLMTTKFSSYRSRSRDNSSSSVSRRFPTTVPPLGKRASYNGERDSWLELGESTTWLSMSTPPTIHSTGRVSHEEAKGGKPLPDLPDLPTLPAKYRDPGPENG